MVLQKLEKIFRDKSWETKMEILTESNTLQISTDVATKNSLILKDL